MAKRDNPTPAKRGPGRPAYEPNDLHRRTVYEMAAYGIPHDNISYVLGISKTLMKQHYQRELHTALAVVTQHVARGLVRRALNRNDPDSTKAAMFFLKTRGGWVDRSEVTNINRDERAPTQELATDDPNEASRAYQRIINGEGE